jgi:DNA-binding transcriptional MerR regulator
MSTNGHTELTSGKSLFRIGEVSRLTDTKPFVLRYWETEFPMLQPVKSPKGHRLYRREDVETVRHIKRLLYDEGFTIAGARRHLREASDAQQGVAQRDIAQHDETRTEAAQSPDVTQRNKALFDETHRGEFAAMTEARPHVEAGSRSEDAFVARTQAPASSPINRKVLVDLRDSLRAFLTLLESE